jgi:hypothetical protein
VLKNSQTGNSTPFYDQQLWLLSLQVGKKQAKIALKPSFSTSSPVIVTQTSFGAHWVRSTEVR